MLFRQRVSLQGALHIRRRVYDEMATYNASVNARHGAQSLRRESSSTTTPQAIINATSQSADSPAHALSRTRDCRWKRGRPVTFSGRSFSTEQGNLNAHAYAVQVESASGLARQSHGQRETATPSSRGSHGTGHDNLDLAPELELNMPLASCEDSTADDVANTNYTPSSTDQSSDPSESGESDTDNTVEEAAEIHKALEFQIPENVLRAAMAAPENTKASFWSSNLYRDPDDRKILVHYCKTKEVAERVAKHFVGQEAVGFDIEWKPFGHPSSIKSNVSLIQLACEDRIALFHVALFSGNTAAQLMPPTLKTILESPEVYKVGVAIKGDFSRVVKYFGINPQGVFELSRLHNLVQFYLTDPSKVTNKLVGLAAQVQLHLRLPLYKGGQLIDDPEDTYNVRSSDWTLPLNQQQIHYAAADAYAGYRLYDVLEEKRKQLKPTPSRPLVCDYDSKPKPRSSDNKPRKKRAAATKTEEAASAVTKSSTPAEQGSELEENMGEEAEQSQDTENYETAQEDLLDSHQLEGEESLPTDESYQSTDESIGDDGSIEPAPPQAKQEFPVLTDANQRRIGCVNLSRLTGPDPGYPVLPRLPTSECSETSTDEALVDISENRMITTYHTHGNGKQAGSSDAEGTTDEFDDSELEEAMRGLTIDSEGRLKEPAEPAFSVETSASLEQLDLSDETSEAANDVPERKTEHDPAKQATQTQLEESTPSPKDEEQHLIDLLQDPQVAEYLHSPTHPGTPSTTNPPSTLSNPTVHTTEYNLATTWAQTYLASTIPSPTSRAPSHIRATVPHLRAYNMWRHQGLSLGEIARHLRDPPLLESTAGSYVLQAITLEKMEFEEEDVRRVLMSMPGALRRGKWRVLAERLGVK